MNTVNKPFRKKDAMQLVTGQPVYMDDLVPADCLIVKLLRSPHANAIVKSINTAVAKKVPGIEAIFTWEDVPQDARRYTQAGQTYPEASPYDRLVIDRHVRFVGDVVAIVAGKDDKCVDKALKMIKVEYEVLEPVLDYHTAKDNPILVHPEDNWESLCPVGGDNKRNLCAHDECSSGDIDAVLADCDVVIANNYFKPAEANCAYTPEVIASLKDGGSFVLAANSPFGPCVHFLYDKWGHSAPGGMMWSGCYTKGKNMAHAVVFAEHTVKGMRDPWYIDEHSGAEYVRTWDDALRILDDGTPKKVVLYPNTECQVLDNSKQFYKQGK